MKCVSVDPRRITASAFIVLTYLLYLMISSELDAAQDPTVPNDTDTLTMNSKIVRVNGLEFPVADVGTGPAVLLLHGFPDSRHVWRHQVGPLVDAGFRVIAPDLRGYGDAPRPPAVAEYRMSVVLGDVVGLLDALNSVPRADAQPRRHRQIYPGPIAPRRIDCSPELVPCEPEAAAARSARAGVSERELPGSRDLERR